MQRYERKINVQARRIKSLQDKYDRLENEYDALKAENKKLKEELEEANHKLGGVSAIWSELKDALSKARHAQSQYTKAYHDITLLRKRYTNAFSEFIDNLRE